MDWNGSDLQDQPRSIGARSPRETADITAFCNGALVEEITRMKSFVIGVLAVAVLTAACSGAPADGLVPDDSQNAGAATDADSGAPGASSSTPSSSGASGGTTAEDSGATGDDASVAPDAGSGSTSNVFTGDGAFTSQSGPSGHHNVGKDCLSCHDGSGGAPEFTFAGTLYDASGNAVAGAEVRVVDGAGNAVSVYTASDGNFYQFGTAFAAPGHAGARDATTTNLMVSAVTKGGCNSCHCSGSSCTTTRLHLP